MGELEGVFMVFKLTRQFGDMEMTCSKLQVFANNNAEPLMECDANEFKFKDYRETFAKCSEYCLPEGVFDVKLKSSKYSGMTVALTRCPGHNGNLVGYEYGRQTMYKTVLIGIRDDQNPETPEEWHESMLLKQKETFDKFNELVYRYGVIENNHFVVINN